MTKRAAKAINKANAQANEAVAVANGEETTKANGKAKALVPCACGCGELARKAFVSSHDAKLAAALRAIARSNAAKEGSKKRLTDDQLDATVQRWEFAAKNPRVAQSPYFQSLVVAAGI